MVDWATTKTTIKRPYLYAPFCAISMYVFSRSNQGFHTLHTDSHMCFFWMCAEHPAIGIGSWSNQSLWSHPRQQITECGMEIEWKNCARGNFEFTKSVIWYWNSFQTVLAVRWQHGFDPFWPKTWITRGTKSAAGKGCVGACIHNMRVSLESPPQSADLDRCCPHFSFQSNIEIGCFGQ